jgi:L-ribulose-5-phosphate 3-epimerase
MSQRGLQPPSKNMQVITMLTFGVRGHDFGKSSAPELARKIKSKNFTCLQLALAKAISGIDGGPGHLNPGLARHIGAVFAENRIQIAVLGCYVNLTHPDPAERENGLTRFKEHLRFCRDFGCSIVGTETGSLNADYSFHPENHGEAAFQTLLSSLASLVSEAEKFGVMVGIEAVATHVVNTPQRMKRVLDTIASGNLQVIFDPVNLLTTANYLEQDRIIEDAFELFGERIQALHAKDFQLKAGKIQTVPAGQGDLNYPLLFKRLLPAKPYIYTLLEDTRPEFMETSRDYLTGLY